MAPGSISIPCAASAAAARSRSSGVMRALAVPRKLRSITMASPIMSSSGSRSTLGMSRKKWCGESMCVPACTVISTMLDTNPLSSHRTIARGLK